MGVACSVTKATSTPSKTQAPFQQQQQQQLSESLIANNRDGYFTVEDLRFRKYKKLNSNSQHRKQIEWVSLDQMLGQGSFGIVQLGVDQYSGKLLAVKQVVIKEEYRIQQIKQEIELLGSLDHENIVKYYGMQQIDNKMNIFLEYVSGGSISLLLQKYGQFNETLIQNFSRQILKGLDYLHSNGVMHRDLKGANILVDNNGICRLADFGSSKKLTSLKNQSFVGTLNWMSPEILLCQEHTRFADIWAFGCTIIEMATGKAPWNELSKKNQVQLITHIAKSGQSPQIPEHLSPCGQDFLSQCLCVDANKRWNVRKLLEHSFIKIDDQLQQQVNMSSNVSEMLNNVLKNQKFQCQKKSEKLQQYIRNTKPEMKIVSVTGFSDCSKLAQGSMGTCELEEPQVPQITKTYDQKIETSLNAEQIKLVQSY